MQHRSARSVTCLSFPHLHDIPQVGIEWVSTAQRPANPKHGSRIGDLDQLRLGLEEKHDSYQTLFRSTMPQLFDKLPTNQRDWQKLSKELGQQGRRLERA
jgi:hypothetical protein